MARAASSSLILPTLSTLLLESAALERSRSTARRKCRSKVLVCLRRQSRLPSCHPQYNTSPHLTPRHKSEPILLLSTSPASLPPPHRTDVQSFLLRRSIPSPRSDGAIYVASYSRTPSPIVSLIRLSSALRDGTYRTSQAEADDSRSSSPVQTRRTRSARLCR
jgi:hypothetical protein